MMPVNFNTTHKENNFECTICISLYHVYREHFIYFLMNIVKKNLYVTFGFSNTKLKMAM